MSSQIPEASKRVTDILARNQVEAGFGALSAINLLPSQPFHWVGFSVLRQYPVLWLFLLPFMAVTGWIALDIHLYFFDKAGYSSLFKSLLELADRLMPLENKLILGLIAAIPVFFIGNVLLAIVCGIMTHQRPDWRWLLVGFFGAIPLRFIAGRFMPNWKFWGGEARGVMGVDARILQFSTIYAVVCRKSRDEIEELWVRAIGKHVNEIADSLYSYVYIAPNLVFISWFLFIYAATERLISVPNSFANPIFVIVPFFVWLGMTRFLLGVAIFTWLSDPEFKASQGNRWIRLAGMLSLMAVITSGLFWLAHQNNAMLIWT